MNHQQKKILSGVLTVVMILVIFFLRQSIFQNGLGNGAGEGEDGSVVILQTSEATYQEESQETKAKTEQTAKPEQTVKPEKTAKPDQTTKSSETEQSLRFRSKKLLNQHYEKHGIEMGFESAADYEAAAAAVVVNEDALHKTEKEDGDDIYYLEETNEFVVVSKDGYLRTYFLPDAGIKYYNKQ
ncbi:MAG: hypothetical protein IKQ25_00855 [Lachnospiraceae bacterium]|nr:hypothetical protein [Lachnospiraceae bacterium]